MTDYPGLPYARPRRKVTRSRARSVAAGEYAIPLPGGQRGSVVISGPWPLSLDEWRFVIDVLDVLQPALTGEGIEE